MSFKSLAYDWFMKPGEILGFARRRRSLLQGIRGRVLEIGVGTGLNLPHYGRDLDLVAVDPQMPLLSRAKRRRRDGQTLVCARAEALPFRDATFGVAVGTLVFCTVNDPEAGLGEVRRVLSSEGELRVIEHVRWERRPALGRIQDLLTPAWKRVADGCHLNRNTLASLLDAGFEVESLREDVGGLVVEVRARRG